MFCFNCASELVPADKLMSRDNWDGDYYTHYCPTCKHYHHVHIHGNNVTLMTTGDRPEVASKVIDNVVAELEVKLNQLKNRVG